MSYPARPLLYAIADYLASSEHAGQSDKVREQLQAAATLVAGAGEFDLSSASDRASLGRCTPQDFAAAFHATHEGASAGANPVAGEASAASSNSVESSEEFQAFLQKVTSKGYFGSSEKGSPEYELKYRRALEKFTAKLSSRTAQKEAKEAAAKQKQQVSEEQALAKKTEGNSKLKAGEHEAALACYREAYALSPSGPSTHIFHANAAAALVHMERYEEAAQECVSSIALKDDYSKSHSRLGYSKLKMGDPSGAIPHLERALEIDGNNRQAQAHLQTARSQAGSTAATPAAPGAGGMPDLASMLGGAGGGPGGAGGLGGMMQQMMQNPGFMQQAQQMMQNPAMMQMAQQMMQDPNAMGQALNALGSMGGGNGAPGEGGMPDLSGLMSAMGGMGGAGGEASAGDGSAPDLSQMMAALGGAGQGSDTSPK